MQLPESEYTIVQLRVQAFFVFLASIFLVLALGTQVMDVLSAYFGINLSPRQALVVVTAIYAFMVGTWFLSEILPANVGGCKTTFIVTHIFFSSVVLVLLEVFPNLVDLSSAAQKRMEGFVDFVVGLVIFVSAGLATVYYYEDNKKKLASQ